MNPTFTLSTIGGIIVAVLLFIVLKRVIGLVFRLILAGVLVLAVILGGWWWSSSKSNDSTGNDNARPRRTRASRTQ
jgi:high-affinity Fe2+/Pb2+ permease